MDSVTNILAAISALGSAIAAGAALAQTRKAAKSTEAAIYVHMMQQYASPTMRDAIRKLAQWGRDAREKGTDVADEYSRLMEHDNQYASDLRGSSRILSTYFCDAARLYETKFTTKQGLLAMISHPGINVFYDVAVPINAVKNQNHNSIRASEKLRRVLPRHGDGIF